MDVFLIKAAQLILALAFLIIIHEFGHFLFARIFGVKVEKFYIFFDPWKEIAKWKPGKYFGIFGSHHKLKNADENETSGSAKNVSTEDTTTISSVSSDKKESEDKSGKKKKSSFWGDTEYGIGWIPLGGYCKIAGMIDESMDTEQLKQPVQDWEFRSKPAWQRLLIMIGGVLFNFLLAILIYAGIVYATGEKYVPFKDARYGMEYSAAAQKVGFRNGDIPLSADGKELDYPSEATMAMMQAKEVKVLRGNDTVAISIPEKFIFSLEDEAKANPDGIHFLTYRIPVGITQVMSGEGAAKAGVKEGDRIIAVDSVATPYLGEFHSVLDAQAEANKKLNKSKQGKVTLTIVRENKAGVSDTLHLPVTLSEGNKMGVGLEVDLTKFLPVKEKHYNLFTAVPRGIQMGTERLTAYAKSMKLVATKEGAKSIGGFGSIGAIFPEKWDWIAFWNIAAFLSVALAFMNILPIPALDGGHVLFLLYEIIFRRKPSQKFMEYAQMIGMGFLILLLLYANGMDIIRLFK